FISSQVFLATPHPLSISASPSRAHLIDMARSFKSITSSLVITVLLLTSLLATPTLGGKKGDDKQCYQCLGIRSKLYYWFSCLSFEPPQVHGFAYKSQDNPKEPVKLYYAQVMKQRKLEEETKDTCCGNCCSCCCG